jgi:phosphoserine phosphatase
MENVLTLISDPAAPATTQDVIDTALSALRDAGAAGDILPQWLAQDIACDLPFGGIDPEQAEQAVKPALNGASVDLFAQPAAGRRKKLLIADMDSTMIGIECIDEIADYAGKKAEVSAITERAMRGELNFAESLIERAAMLTGLDERVLEQAFAERLCITPGAKDLVATMRASGAYTALVSGGFTFFTSKVREMLGFESDQANTLIIENGRLTGEVARPILDSSAKLDALERLIGELRIGHSDALAVGDGANDLPMIQSAGLGVAYHAKPLVAAAAKARIDHGDLTALLYLQGYRQQDFASS